MGTWKFVESPFRKKTIFSRKTVFSFSLFFSLFFIAAGTAILFFQEKDERFQHEIRTNYGLNYACEFNDNHFDPGKDCATSESPEILVWGDSFAMHLVPGLLASNHEIRMAQATRSVCGPFLKIG